MDQFLTNPLARAAISGHFRHVAINAKADFGLALARAVMGFDRRFAIMVVGVTLVAIAMAGILVGQGGPQAVFFEEQASLYQISDTRFRRLFYTLFMVLGFTTFLISGLLQPAKPSPPSEPSQALIDRLEKAWPILLIGFLLAVSLRLRLGDLLAALLLAYLVTQVLSGHVKTRTLSLALAAATVLLYVAPFTFTHMIEAGGLWTMDTHWTAVLGPSMFTAPFSGAAAMEAVVAYGVLLNQTLAAVNETFFGGTMAGAMASLKLFNVVFAVIVAIIIAQRSSWTNRRMIVLGSLIVMLLFAAMAANVALTFETPNQLPVRFLCVPVAIALAPILARIGNLSGWLLVGVVSPFFIAWNVEVGVQCLLSLGFAMFLKAARDGVAAVVLGGALFGLSFLAVGTTLLLTLFDMPLARTLTDIGARFSAKAAVSSSGFGGTTYFLYLPFIVVLGHSLIGFFQYLRSLRSSATMSVLQFQGAVLVGLIVISSAYVMNRYAIWNMWVPMLLYVLWILPKLAQTNLRMARVWAFITIAVAMPFAMGTPVTQMAKAFKPSQSVFVNSSAAQPCADGVLARPALCKYLEGKALELKELGGGKVEVLWLSSLTLMMHRLTNTDSAMSQRSLFFLAHRRELFDPVVNDLKTLASDTILTDKVTSGNAAGIPQGVRDFQHRLVTQAGYELVKDGAYWHVYKKPQS